MMQSIKTPSEIQFNRIWDCSIKINKNEGPKAFYKGAFINLLRVNASMVLVIYDEMQNYLIKNK
jgi:solute carrier family 25 (adenine nucleotide translocator) protein 4/5/6/31